MKNILLIGGSYGIGLALMNELQSSNNLFVASRTPPQANSDKVTYIAFDAASDDFDLSTLPEVIDGFVYLPGTINLKPFRAIKPEAFLEEMQINFINMVKVLQAVLPKISASPSASIVLFSSVAATVGLPFHTSIAAAKGAVEGFARAFAAEYAPTIRMNTIAPSLTDTALANKFLNTADKQQKSSDRHPLKRYGKAEDAAQMAAFLLSDKSSWITGQTFHVDGGMSTIIVNQ